MANGIAGKPRLAIEHGRTALARYKALGNRIAVPSISTAVGLWLGYCGNRAEGEALLREGLDAALAVGSRSDEAWAHQARAEILTMFGEFATAMGEVEIALDIARRIGHREWIGAALCAFGRLRRECGDLAGARALHEEELAITKELGNALWDVEALGELGHDALALGDGGRSITPWPRPATRFDTR
jgi:hypothetical protein